MDEDVHGAITRGLILRGVDVITVQSDNRTGSSDQSVLDRATELGRVLFTNDSDFLIEAKRRQSSVIAFSGILFAHAFTAIGSCVRELELIATTYNLDQLTNRVLYLPLR